MKKKIPPPILALLMIGLVYSLLLIGSISFDYQASLSVLLVIGGELCIAFFRLFARNKTTISPFTLLRPCANNRGQYRYSRNPMYLGLLLLIIAATIWFGTWFGIIMPLFLFYL